MISPERAMLLDIVRDMQDWPEAQDLSIRQVDLLGYSYYGGSEPRTAILLVQTERPETYFEWMIVHLENSHVHYFKRKIWFYRLIADGAVASFKLVDGRRDPAVEVAIERRPYGPYEVKVCEKWRLDDVG